MEDDHNSDEAQALANFEKQVMAGLKPDAEDPILELPPVEVPTNDPGAAPAAAPAAPAPAAPATAPAPAPAAPQAGQGDPRAALRAARAAERITRARADELAKENARLREQLGQPKAGQEVDPDVQNLIDDVPTAAPVIKKLVQQVKELTQQSAAPKQAEAPAFVPDMLPPALQAAVEQVPQLEDWQHDPDQTAWTLAKRVDTLLLDHPAWKDKPEVERLAEVARRVSSELGAPSTTTPTPQQRQQAVREHEPETLSDLRGGLAPTNNPGPDFSRMKSDDEVMAALERLR